MLYIDKIHRKDKLSFTVKDLDNPSYVENLTEDELHFKLIENTSIEGVLIKPSMMKVGYNYYEVSTNPSDLKWQFMHPNYRIKRDGRRLVSFICLETKEDEVIDLSLLCDEIDDNTIILEQNCCLRFSESIIVSNNPVCLYANFFTNIGITGAFFENYPNLDLLNCSDTKSTEILSKVYDIARKPFHITPSKVLKKVKLKDINILFSYITNYCFRHPSSIEDIKNVDSDYLEEYFKEHTNDIISVLNRRNLTISDIDDLGRYIAGKNKNTELIINTKPSFPSTEMLDFNKGLYKRIRDLKLSSSNYVTEDDSKYLIAALYAWDNLDSFSLYIELNNFFVYVHRRYWSLSHSMLHTIIYVLCCIIRLIFLPFVALYRIYKSFKKI